MRSRFLEANRSLDSLKAEYKNDSRIIIDFQDYIKKALVFLKVFELKRNREIQQLESQKQSASSSCASSSNQ